MISIGFLTAWTAAGFAVGCLIGLAVIGAQSL